jgi:hypothetical protein
LKKNEKSPITVSESILHRTEKQATIDAQKREIRRMDQLKDLHNVRWFDIQKNATSFYENMSGGSMAIYMKLLVVMLSCGPRKSAVIDPDVQFITLDEYEKVSGRNFDEDGDFHFGSADDHIPIDLKKFQKESKGRDWVIVQIGVLKDKDQRINKYLLKGDSRYVLNRIVIKPTILYPAKDIVELVRKVRTFFGTTKKNHGLTREQMGKKVDSDKMKAILTKAFPEAAQKAELNNWPWNTHFCRKLYVNSCVDIYTDQIFLITGKRNNRSVLMKTFLSHEGSLATTFSYSTVEIIYDPNVLRVYALPPEHMIRLFLTDMQILKDENQKMKDRLENMELMVSTLTQQPNIKTLKSKGGNVAVMSVRKFKGTKEERYIEAVQRLQSLNMKVTIGNIKTLGIGSSTISIFRKKYPNDVFSVVVEEQKVEEQKVEEQKVDVPMVIDDDISLGYKVIVDPMPESISRSAFEKGNAGTKQFKAATKLANAQRTKRNRDVKKFGSENVTLLEDCTGVVQKKLKMAKGVVRDVCL